VRDSASLADSTFQAYTIMTIRLRQSDDSVHIDERLLLTKEHGANYRTEQLSRKVTGDSSIIRSMYSFEDARGNPRGAEQARLASLNFGTSFPLLLRDLLAAAEGSGYELDEGNAVLGSRRCSLFSYETEQKSGRFWIDNGSFDLVRLEVRQQSNYVVGSYDYRALIDFSRSAGALLLPVKTSTQFDYRRVFTRGTGMVDVVFDSVSAKPIR
jgi:hypothetical protein